MGSCRGSRPSSSDSSSTGRTTGRLDPAVSLAKRIERAMDTNKTLWRRRGDRAEPVRPAPSPDRLRRLRSTVARSRMTWPRCARTRSHTSATRWWPGRGVRILADERRAAGRSGWRRTLSTSRAVSARGRADARKHRHDGYARPGGGSEPESARRPTCSFRRGAASRCSSISVGAHRHRRQRQRRDRRRPDGQPAPLPAQAPASPMASRTLAAATGRGQCASR